MTDQEIQKAAEELFKDSEYPVPNIYCFTKGAKWALSHQWVSVEEGLPEPWEDVLIYTDKGQVKMSCWYGYSKDKAELFSRKNNWKWWGNTHPNVLYWMPIPAFSFSNTTTEQND